MSSQFSAFAPFGAFRFSSRKPPAEVIYESLQDSQGDAFDIVWNGEQSRRLYCQAMVLGNSHWTLWRGANGGNPSITTENIPLLEQDFAIVPRPTAPIAERRADLIATMRSHHGARYDSIYDGLMVLLGDDLIAIYVRPVPTPSGSSLPGTFPGTLNPNQGQGKFASADTIGTVVAITSGVTMTGSPQQRAYTIVAGYPVQPKVGDTFVCNPGKTGRTELVTIEAVGQGLLTCTWQHGHDSGCRMTSCPFPYALSTRLHWGIVITQAVVDDPWRQIRVHRFLSKAMQGVSIWDLVLSNGDGTAGPFEVASGLIGFTPIEEVTY